MIVECKYCAEAADEIERLRGRLEGRDMFIVKAGLWQDFVKSLPSPGETINRESETHEDLSEN